MNIIRMFVVSDTFRIAHYKANAFISKYHDIITKVWNNGLDIFVSYNEDTDDEIILHIEFVTYSILSSLRGYRDVRVIRFPDLHDFNDIEQILTMKTSIL